MPEQHNEVAHGVEVKLVDRVLAFKRQIGVALVALLVALVAYLIIDYMQQKADQKAWTSIFAAQYSAQIENKPEAQLLETVITECSGARALFYARMLQYGDLALIGSPESLKSAQEACEAFLKDYPSHPFAGQVRVDYGSILANQGKTDLARAQYAQVAKNGPDYVRVEAALFEALCLEKEGKLQEALDAYGKIINNPSPLYMNDIIVDYASFAKANLLQKQTAAATPAATPAAPAMAPAAAAADAKPAAAVTPAAPTAPAAPVAPAVPTTPEGK